MYVQQAEPKSERTRTLTNRTHEAGSLGSSEAAVYIKKQRIRMCTSLKTPQATPSPLAGVARNMTICRDQDRNDHIQRKRTPTVWVVLTRPELDASFTKQPHHSGIHENLATKRGAEATSTGRLISAVTLYDGVLPGKDLLRR